MISTYSGASVQGAGQSCSILLGNVCVREFVGRGLKSEEERKEKVTKSQWMTEMRGERRVNSRFLLPRDRHERERVSECEREFKVEQSITYAGTS